MGVIPKPCRCGYEGKLNGLHNGFWNELTCPKCKRSVSAFTPSGLVEAWNKEPEQPAEEKDHDHDE